MERRGDTSAEGAPVEQVQQYVKHSVDLRAAGEQDQVHALVGRSLDLMAREVPDAFRTVLVHALDRAVAGDPPLGDASRELTAAIRDLPPGTMESDAWIALRHLLIAHGFIVASGAARTHARQTAIDRITGPDRSDDPGMLFRGLQAHLDAGDIETARGIRSQLPNIPPLRPVLWSLDSYLRLAAGELPEEALSRAAPRDFRRMIENRSVAVVGPAQSRYEHGEDIDRHGVVVRVNYWGKNRSAPKSRVGARTDISYYNMGEGEKIDERTCGFLDELKYVVFKSDRHALREHAWRRIVPVTSAYFAGHPNMIPIIVFDLLHFRPKKVTVYGSNFFLSERSHHTSYVGFTTDHVRNRLLSFASHDLCDQTRVMRAMQACGRVRMDEDGSRVLSLSDEEYLGGMEQIWWWHPDRDETEE